MTRIDQDTIDAIVRAHGQGVGVTRNAKRNRVSKSTVWRVVSLAKEATKAAHAAHEAFPQPKPVKENHWSVKAHAAAESYLLKALHATRSQTRKLMRREWQRSHPPPYPWRTVVSNEMQTDLPGLRAWIEAHGRPLAARLSPAQPRVPPVAVDHEGPHPPKPVQTVREASAPTDATLAAKLKAAVLSRQSVSVTVGEAAYLYVLLSNGGAT